MKFFSSIGDKLKTYSKPATDLVGAIYDIYRDQRDFDYAKHLQKQMFEREDTAVQRRAADLQAAGMNPYLAAGSPAGAGAVVGHVGTSPRNIGSLLDASMALQQDKQAKLQTQIAENEKKISDYKVKLAKYESNNSYFDMKDRADSFYFNRGYETDYNFGDSLTDTDVGSSYYNSNKHGKMDLPFYNILQYQIDNQKNSADLLQKQNEYYTSDKIMNYVGSLIPFMNMGRNYLNRR